LGTLLVSYETLIVAQTGRAVAVTLNRPAHENALTDLMMDELHAALDMAERLPACRMVVIQGANGIFCGGMDLADAGDSPTMADHSAFRRARFFSLLRRFTTIPRAVVSVVDGSAIGGGVGLAAASDFVLASERAKFSLPEALWGLLPCSVAPFLMRRIGFQASYAMTLSTLPISAHRAERFGLVDEVCHDPQIPLRRLAARVTRLEEATVAAGKRYFARLWPISEEMEVAALSEFERLFTSASVQHAIAAFNGPGRSFPWER
jgi:3-carboxymethyl-3-hydroxy-acyl-[acp] dehydratase